MKKKAVLFLEPKGAIFEVVAAARRQGLAVAAITLSRSGLQNTAQPYDRHIPLLESVHEITAWDEELLWPIIESLKLIYELVGTYASVENCLEFDSKLRAHLGLPHNKLATVSLILNKYQLRQHLREAGLSQLRAFTPEGMHHANTWPLGANSGYFKPQRGYGSLCVKKVCNLADYQQAVVSWQEHIKGSTVRNWVNSYITEENSYFVEEAHEGELLSVESLVIAGKVTTLGLLSRILYSKDHVVEMGSVFPYEHPWKEKIIAKAEQIHHALDYNYGATHLEFIVSNTGAVELIDFNPRFVGADVLQSVNNAFGCNIEDVLLSLALGRELKDLNFSPKAYSCLQYFFAPPIEEKFEDLTFPHHQQVVFRSGGLKPGTLMKATNNQTDVLGCYLTSASSFEEALQTSRELRKQVRVNSCHEVIY